MLEELLGSLQQGFHLSTVIEILEIYLGHLQNVFL